jgi:hypothetical protein
MRSAEAAVTQAREGAFQTRASLGLVPEPEKGKDLADVPPNKTLALLPPQHATGNFVKIVQRLPVRIELTDYDPDKVPLFVGLSVSAYVYFKEPPTGPARGRGAPAHGQASDRTDRPQTLSLSDAGRGGVTAQLASGGVTRKVKP